MGDPTGAPVPQPVWVDSHCHLTMDMGDADVVAARQAGVAAVITIGVDVADSRKAIAIAGRHRDVRAAAGVHPHEASGGTDGLVDLLDHDEVVAVGGDRPGLPLRPFAPPRPAAGLRPADRAGARDRSHARHTQPLRVG